LHRCKLWNATSRLKLICSDTAAEWVNHSPFGLTHP
jgi:hypothetical protein